MIEQHASGPARRDAGRGVGPSIVMAAGLGWVGGNYHWPGPQRFEQLLITVAHVVPVALVLISVLAIVSGRHPQAGQVVLTVLACMIKAVTVFAVVWVLIHPQGFGSRGFLDWVPIGMANAGGGLWLKTIRRRHPVGTTPPPSDWADVRDCWHHLRTV